MEEKSPLVPDRSHFKLRGKNLNEVLVIFASEHSYAMNNNPVFCWLHIDMFKTVNKNIYGRNQANSLGE